MRSARTMFERFNPICADDAFQGSIVFVNGDHTASSVNQKSPAAAHAVITIIVGVAYGPISKSLDCEKMSHVPDAGIPCAEQALPCLGRPIRCLGRGVRSFCIAIRRDEIVDAYGASPQPSNEFQHWIRESIKCAHYRRWKSVAIWNGKCGIRAIHRNTRVAK